MIRKILNKISDLIGKIIVFLFFSKERKEYMESIKKIKRLEVEIKESEKRIEWLERRKNAVQKLSKEDREVMTKKIMEIIRDKKKKGEGINEEEALKIIIDEFDEYVLWIMRNDLLEDQTIKAETEFYEVGSAIKDYEEI